MDTSGNNVNETQHFTYVWTIENLTKYWPYTSKLASPIFTVKKMEMTKWHLTIGIDMSENIVCDIRRAKEDNGPKAIEVKFEISFLGIDGLPLIERVHEGKFENKDFIEFKEFTHKHEVFVRRKSEFLPREALTIRCRMWRIGTRVSQIDSCFARTRLQPDRHSFMWAIRDFSTLQRDKVRKIHLRKNPNSVLTLNLVLTEKAGEEYVSINLEYSAMDGLTVIINLLDFEGKVVYAAERRVYIDNNLKFENFIPKSRLMNDKMSLLPNDVMSLRCDIEVSAKVVWSTIENYNYLNSNSYRVVATDEAELLHIDQEGTSNSCASLIEAMESLIDEGTLSDVILRTDSTSLPAHKCILSARSPVFREMFEEGTNGETSNSVEISDVDEDTLDHLLSYIYMDSVGELGWRSSIELYEVAYKYGLFDLMRRCATFLKSDLSVSNVCDILNVADKCEDTKLREAAQDFVMQQKAEFFKTDRWRYFKRENSELAAEVLEIFLENHLQI